jgi:DNA-binding transcriptional LysR family regulator
VTQQIRLLEAQFGIKLFRIKKQKAHLTPVGEKLLGHAEEFMHHVRMMDTFLKTHRLATLHIGISNALTLYMVPVIDRFKEDHPSVQVSVREDFSEDLVNQLLDYKHDICFVLQAGAATGPASYPTDFVTAYRIPRIEKMVFVASAEYPIKTDVESRWEELAREPLIIPSEGSTPRKVLVEQFAKRDLPFIVGTEISNIEYGRQLVRQGKGIGLMFWPNVREDVDSGKLKIVRVAGGDIHLGIDVLLNSEIATSPLLLDFITVLKNHFGDIHPILAED